MSNYYSHQMYRLPSLTDSVKISVVFIGSNADGSDSIRTNHLDLNEESIPQVIEYLEHLLHNIKN